MISHVFLGVGEFGAAYRFHADYYGAYFRDPDGNKLAVCCHDPG